MENLDLLNQSYCISCDHIKKINEEYKKYNDTVFNKQFSCIRNKNKEDYNYNYIYNTNSNDIIGSSYITFSIGFFSSYCFYSSIYYSFTSSFS